MKNAKWLTFDTCDAPLAHKVFGAENVQKAVIQICGLGFFELYINGTKVSEDVLNPAWTDYEPRENRRMLYPIHDTFQHRIYYREYDVSEFIKEGANWIEVLLGNGWYNQHERNIEGDFWYGNPKLCFTLKMYHASGECTEVYSDEEMLWRPSVITFNNVYIGEHQDFRLNAKKEFFACTSCKAPEGELVLQTCPSDRAIRIIKPILLYTESKRSVYDVGENISGHVRFSQIGTNGAQTVIRFAENIFADYSLDFHSAGGEEQIQTDICISDGSKNHFEPRFTWHGFRYFEIENDTVGVEIDNVEAVVVHSDIGVTSHFVSDSLSLNWLYDSYIRTQLDNMHCGIVTDCPHRERLGYTGDGQLCCEAAMLLLDSRQIYEKWIQDIADCQDPDSGHVQHTAPFYGGGGGPGGWGSAIVVVPYFFYKHFGDRKVIEKYLPNMHKWVAYMESRSEKRIVVREETGGWCLGDWCTPLEVLIPESFVNTYFFIKALGMMAELSEVLGQKPDLLLLKRKMILQAFQEKFYDECTNSYCGGVQGADAFAIDLGLGNTEMLERLANHYDILGEFDTGIFGTDIVLRVLFEHGYEDVAYKLLSSEKKNSFGHQRLHGATTIWESWNGEASHNHPMFGACSRYLFQYILGLQQRESSAAYDKFYISPRIPKALQKAEGKLVLPIGEVSIKFSKEAGKIKFEICLPEHAACEFSFREEKRTLFAGQNSFEI